LVSIQGLVLVDDPYYNEAGYEKQSGTEEGKRNGDQYNEQAFLASVRSMIATLRDPPMHFEQLIRAHFKKRSVKILEACAAYLNESCPIGQHEKWRAEKRNAGRAGDGSGASASDPVGSPDDKKEKGPSRPPPTEGFKLTLRKLMPKLEAAFKANDETVDASGA
jgi:ubiquitin-conjugating enzyme E2 O